jgi:hypothetical protein
VQRLGQPKVEWLYVGEFAAEAALECFDRQAAGAAKNTLNSMGDTLVCGGEAAFEAAKAVGKGAAGALTELLETTVGSLFDLA